MFTLINLSVSLDVTGWMQSADLELKQLYKTDCPSISQKAGLKGKA